MFNESAVCGKEQGYPNGTSLGRLARRRGAKPRHGGGVADLIKCEAHTYMGESACRRGTLGCDAYSQIGIPCTNTADISHRLVDCNCMLRASLSAGRVKACAEDVSVRTGSSLSPTVGGIIGRGARMSMVE